MSLFSTIRRFFRNRHEDALAKRSFELRAVCAGTIPCPHCKDTGPHEDNAGRGGGLAFRCRFCRSLFKMKDYDWERAWKQPRSENGEAT